MNAAIRTIYIYSLKYNKNLWWRNKYSIISSGYAKDIFRETFEEYMRHDIRSGRVKLALYE